MKYKSYPKHKPSGIQWLGDIPSHWEVKKVKHLSTLQSGKNIVSEQINETGDYPVYGGNGIRGYYTKYTNDGDYILIGRQGALCGNINYASGKFWASEHAVVVYLKDNVNKKWFGEILRIMNLNQYSESAAQPGLAVDKIKRLPLPLPPLTEQHAIAAFLDRKTKEIDSFLETKKNLIAVLKEQKAAIINDAVTGKYNSALSFGYAQDRLAQGDKVCHGEPVESMQIEQAPIRPAQGDNKTKPSGIEWLGDIPSHWEVKKLKRFSHITYGMGQPPKQVHSGIPFIRATNISKGNISDDGMMYVDYDQSKLLKDVILRSGDIIVVRSGAYTADSAIIPEKYDGAIAGYDMVVRCHNDIYKKFVAYTLLSHFALNSQLFLERMRAAIPHLNAEQLGNTLIPLPPLPEQQAIVAHIEKEMERIDYIIQQTEKEMELMKEYKQALISEAVTGKIRVE